MRVRILGCDISVLHSYEDAYEQVLNRLKEEKGYISINNVHTIVRAVLHSDYKRIINTSLLSFPDGKPIAVYAKYKTKREINRITGPTFLKKSLEWGQQDKIKHYFFGSTPETLKKINNIISQQYPNALIVGNCSPPFRELTDEENQKYISDINSKNPDIIWVGLGAPRQDIWISKNISKIKRGILVGVGAGFDYLAGNIKRAPDWMQKYSLEWLYRLIQDPKRLFKRYLVTNSLFCLFILLEITHLKKFD